jgi:hypothetical protein
MAASTSIPRDRRIRRHPWAAFLARLAGSTRSRATAAHHPDAHPGNPQRIHHVDPTEPATVGTNSRKESHHGNRQLAPGWATGSGATQWRRTSPSR